jgi:hypothetical protein
LLVLFGLVGAGLSPAYAAVTCFSDTDGPNDPPGDGQGDITRFCLDNANLPSSFDVCMNWDEASFNGANTAAVSCSIPTGMPEAMWILPSASAWGAIREAWWQDRCSTAAISWASSSRLLKIADIESAST